jgi:hypothetical protein
VTLARGGKYRETPADTQVPYLRTTSVASGSWTCLPRELAGRSRLTESRESAYASYCVFFEIEDYSAANANSLTCSTVT